MSTFISNKGEYIILTISEGKQAVTLARDTIETLLRDEQRVESSSRGLARVFNEERGVFVTLTTRSGLRGCIGHPYPDSALKDAIVDSAISAATRDPRFPAVQMSEMDTITVEVTVLTPPERIDVPPHELPDAIEIGRHGLIVKMGFNSGLLLPQVAPENNFSVIEFLNHTCMKAALPPDAWLNGAEVYCFEGQIFKESAPRGEIIEGSFTTE